jgi:hypothetical protein
VCKTKKNLVRIDHLRLREYEEDADYKNETPVYLTSLTAELEKGSMAEYVSKLGPLF